MSSEPVTASAPRALLRRSASATASDASVGPGGAPPSDRRSARLRNRYRQPEVVPTVSVTAAISIVSNANATATETENETARAEMIQSTHQSSENEGSGLASDSSEIAKSDVLDADEAKQDSSLQPPCRPIAGPSTYDNAQTVISPPPPDRPDCGICLEPCLHPVKLPCGHIFCYLCVKGAVKQSGRCAYCRAEVPDKYLNKPELLEAAELDLRHNMEQTEGFQWMYQGRNGWWRYDKRTNDDIEAAFSEQQASVQIQVAGELYTVDLVSMTQYNDQCRGRRRRICRNTAASGTTRCKGVAGLRKKPRRDSNP